MVFSKKYFERVFARGDSWGYGFCQYERVKYSRQLEIAKLYAPRPKTILEIGCAEGRHTLMLGEAFPEARIRGVDISNLAVEQAKQNCQGCESIEFVVADITEMLKHSQLPQDAFDIVIQSECLYYLFPKLLAQMSLGKYVRGLTGILKNSGIFVTSNGLIGVTRYVMDIYYLMLKEFCRLEYAAEYREWNEFRNKYITYDIKIFRKEI